MKQRSRKKCPPGVVNRINYVPILMKFITILTTVSVGMEKLMLGVYASLACWLPFIAAAGSECDMTTVQSCVGSATDLLPRIYFNPSSSELLGDIKENYCGKGVEQCLQYEYGNCSINSLAPYETLVNTINLVCRTDIVSSSCLARGDVQHACTFCFELFKVVVDSVVSDTSLSLEEVNKGLCGAYYDVKSCCMDSAFTVCDTSAQAYISTLLSTTTRANRAVLGC